MILRKLLEERQAAQAKINDSLRQQQKAKLAIEHKLASTQREKKSEDTLKHYYSLLSTSTSYAVEEKVEDDKAEKKFLQAIEMCTLVDTKRGSGGSGSSGSSGGAARPAEDTAGKPQP